MSQIKDIISRFSSELEAAIRQEVATQLLAAAGVQGAVAAPSPSPRASKAKATPTAAKSDGRRVRRSAEQLEAIQAKIIKALGTKKLTSEEIQAATGLSKDDIQRPLQLLRDEKQVRTSGQKRAMTYAAK